MLDEKKSRANCDRKTKSSEGKQRVQKAGPARAQQSQPDRNTKGQGLIEASCGTCIFVMVFVGLVMLALNCYVVLTADTTLRLIAQESAKVREDYTFFLGARRRDVTEEQARQIATSFAVALANANGLAVNADGVSFNDTTTASQSGTRCTIRLDGLRMPYSAGIFPIAIKREVSAVVARMNVPAPAIVDINAQGEGGTITLRVPSYGAYRPVSTAMTGDGRFALSRQDLFSATALPGCPFPNEIKHNFYYGMTVGQGRILGPITTGSGNQTYTNPDLLPQVGQTNFRL